MIVWLYSVMHNEERILPHFLAYYSGFCDRMIIYDHDSTDATAEIVKAHKLAELRQYTESPGMMDEVKFVDFANGAWKEARGLADWIIWVDADEFIYHPCLREYLQACLFAGATMPGVQGYTMIADCFPDDCMPYSVTSGVPDDTYSKQAVFSPEIDEISYLPGKHVCSPQGRIVIPYKASIKLLHYRYFGSDYLVERNCKQYERQNEDARRNRWGVQVSPDFTGKYSLEWYEHQKAEAVNVLAA